MKTVDKIDNKERIEKLTEQKKSDLFTDLILGKDVIEEVETSRGKFEIKYPKPVDHLTIGKLAAIRRNFRPQEAFDGETESLVLAVSTLDVVVVSGPDWYEKAKTKNENFTFMEVPSRAFISELYGKAYSFREKVEQRLNSPTGTDDKSVPAAESPDVSVDGGAFGNLSSEPDDTES